MTVHTAAAAAAESFRGNVADLFFLHLGSSRVTGRVGRRVEDKRNFSRMLPLV